MDVEGWKSAMPPWRQPTRMDSISGSAPGMNGIDISGGFNIRASRACARPDKAWRDCKMGVMAFAAQTSVDRGEWAGGNGVSLRGADSRETITESRIGA